MAEAMTLEDTPVDRDPWVPHFLRFVCIGALVTISQMVLLGFIWHAMILRRTGYRARDTLMFLIPIYGAIVSTVTLWRYTARTVYWTPRDDRDSGVLQDGRQALIGVGAAAFVLGVVAVAGAAATVENTEPAEAEQEPFWTQATETEFIDAMVDNNWERRRASCIVGYLEERYPDGLEGVTAARVTYAVQSAGNGPCR